MRRVYWALNGLSLTTSNAFPTTTEQYTIEWFQTIWASEWQPIEGNLRGNPGIAGSDALMDTNSVPWAGAFGQNHQWIGAEDTIGGAGTWVSTGPGPHTPTSTNYNCQSRRDLHVAHPGCVSLCEVGFRSEHSTHLERVAPDAGDHLSAGDSIYLQIR